MAVTVKNAKARVQLKGYEKEVLCSYSNIKPEASADDVLAFSDNVNALRGNDVEHTHIIVEHELEETL